MNDLTASYVQCYVVNIITAGIEQQISRSDAVNGNFFSLGSLVSGASAGGNAKMGKYLLGESGAVCTVCQAGTAIYIWVAQELFRICHDGISGG